MIYIGKVKPSILNEPVNQPIIDYFKSYQPLEIQMPDDKDKQSELKTTVLHGFISGDMKALIRNNNNLVSRDCLILDLDDVVVSESELIEVIRQKFNKFQYILYPSISHRVKGVRYRLIVPLDNSVNESDYKLLVHYANKKLLEGVVGQVDDSNYTWSQLMLLPVITQHSSIEDIIINDTEKQLPTINLLEGAKVWSNQLKPKEQKFIRPAYFKSGGSRYRNTTTNLFESLVLGCEEGNRNNRLAQITGGLLARAVDVEFAYKLVLVANEHFNDPLPIEEVNNTFESICKKELSN